MVQLISYKRYKQGYHQSDGRDGQQGSGLWTRSAMHVSSLQTYISIFARHMQACSRTYDALFCTQLLLACPFPDSGDDFVWPLVSQQKGYSYFNHTLVISVAAE